MRNDRFESSNHKSSHYSVQNNRNEPWKRERRIITSYGIILFTMINNDSEIRYQICQRRDSISYSEFLKDNLTPDNAAMYIGMMSQEERQRCLDFINDPESLWNDLWINHKSKIYKNDMNRCCDAFKKNIKFYIDEFKKINSKTNPWGFSKGRKHVDETYQECALREFEEETTISSNKIQLLNLEPYEELYTGTDGKPYRTIYYVAYIPFIPTIEKKQSNGIVKRPFVSEEVSDIKWLSYNDTLTFIDSHKQQILCSLNKTLLYTKKRKPPPRRFTY